MKIDKIFKLANAAMMLADLERIIRVRTRKEKMNRQLQRDNVALQLKVNALHGFITDIHEGLDPAEALRLFEIDKTFIDMIEHL